MDPNTEHGPDDRGPGPRPAAFGDRHEGTAPTRPVRLVAGSYLLTLNPIDGTEIEHCPPGEARPTVHRKPSAVRADAERAARTAITAGTGPSPLDQPLWEREEERERLVGLLSRGRSVRLVGPAGSGRSRMLDEVAVACADLAPDGVIRLDAAHRTSSDVLHELFAAVYDAPRHRPDREELDARLAAIGAVVVLDDLEFGGDALEAVLRATPECAFLLASSPDAPEPAAGSRVTDVPLGGLSRDTCLTLLEHAIGRPLTLHESEWASELWSACEGLPQRFVQAAALLWHRDTARLGPAGLDGEGSAGVPSSGDRALPAAGPGVPAALLAEPLSGAAHALLRLAVALDGAVPHQTHLSALVADPGAEAALGELLGAGLITRAGTHHRLVGGVREELEAAGYATDAAQQAEAAAQHYTWWVGRSTVGPERVATEADVLLAALAALTTSRPEGSPATAVQLARAAAPALAAALRWGAWERCLRHGQEAARLAGEVAQEAYFHHELGVLALCTGAVDRARAELEASIGLRGVLSDRRGAVAGRRALALVTDRARALAAPPEPVTFSGADVPLTEQTTGVQPVAGKRTGGPLGLVPEDRADAPARDEAPTARVLPSGPSDESSRPTAPTVAVDPAGPAATYPPAALLFDEAEPFGTTTASHTPAAGAGGSAPGKGRPGSGTRSGRRPVFSGARRNVVAAGAGALLAAVLGTVVTLGATSGDTTPSGGVTSEQSADDEGTGDSPATDPATSDTPPPAQDSPSASASPSHSGGDSPSASPSQSPSDQDSGSPSAPSQPSHEPSHPSSPSPTHSHKPSPTPTHTTPTPTPSESEDPTETPDPPTGGTSEGSQDATASGTAAQRSASQRESAPSSGSSSSSATGAGPSTSGSPSSS
ncbi:ATP-binding protein [Streptomyces sp. NPDC059740]|uniref:ATP-binding protein n=1 Tax=Streptomyces sp. NPDC059740 TaxID=3346926 RepID=UPI0036483005